MRTAAYTGLAIAVVGAALDFSAGYFLLQPADGMMTTVGDIEFAIALFALGLVVLAAGAAGVLPKMEGRTKYIGIVMELSGMAMAVISAWGPGMNPLTAFGMLAVGGLIILNGALMQRGPEMAPRV